MNIKSVIQLRPDRAHAGGLVVGEVKSWYNDSTTLGMSDLIMMR
jgi:hypothetical protein